MKAITTILFIILSIALVFSQEKQGIIKFRTENRIIYDICFSEKGEVIAIPDNSTIKIFRTATRELLREFKEGHKGQITTLNISGDSTLLASGGKDSTIVIWDFTNGKILKRLSYHKGIIISLKISPDGRYLVSGGTDDKVVLYDIGSDKLIKEYHDHKDDITCVAFSPDGKLFAASGGDGLVTVYSTENEALVGSLMGDSGWVRGISFNEDGTNILTCGDDSRIIKWDVTDKDAAKKISDDKYGNSWLLCIDNSKYGKTYAFGGLNGLIKVMWAFGTYKGRIGVPVNRILFFPGGGNLIQIAVATRGKGVMLIDGSGLKLKNN